MTAGLLFDLVLGIVCLTQVIQGWKHGLVATCLGILGFLVGGALALWALSWSLDRFAPGLDPTWRSLGLMFGVLLVAAIVHGLLAQLGVRLMHAHRRSGVGRLDSLAGSVLNLVVTGIIIGLLTLSLIPVAPPRWQQVVQQSRIASTSARLLPRGVLDATSGIAERLYAAGFPSVFGSPSDEPSIPVEPPDPKVVDTAAVKKAQQSVIKITAAMPSCRSASEGSGWVAYRNRVITNAHVVAGSDRVEVQPRGVGAKSRATVIYFDPATDLAVLDVPGLSAPALELSEALHTGDSGVVAGFPLNGPYDVEAARVRGTLTAMGRDIYGERGIAREIYSINADVNPGNSGGPLLAADGKVAGTVFARSMVAPETGFVLTNQASSGAIAKARELAGRAVSTGACAS